MPNPLVDQGVLNRVRGSITFATNPGLNITASFLGKAAIKLDLQGETTEYFGTLTGAVRSPQPYMMIEVTANLLKTQALANAYKAKMELDSFLGNMSVRSDGILNIYDCLNCSIKNVRGLDFSGESPDFTVVIGGYYLVNSTLFD